MVQSAETKISHVVQATFAIMKALAAEGLGKNRRNQEQKFNFRGVDDVMNLFAPLLVEHNLLLSPEVLDYQHHTYSRGPDKAPSSRAIVKMTLTFESVLDGSKRVIGPLYGEGGDVADKATGKAMSYAYKDAILKAFCVPVEGNPEDRDPDFTQAGERSEERPAARRADPKPAAKEQVGPETLAQALERLAPKEEGRKKLEAKILEAYGVMLLEEVPADKVQDAIQQAENFVKKQRERAAAKKAK
jgi:hypothetical protein